MVAKDRFTWKPGDIVWTKKGGSAKQTSAQKLADQAKKAKDGRTSAK